MAYIKDFDDYDDLKKNPEPAQTTKSPYIHNDLDLRKFALELAIKYRANIYQNDVDNAQNYYNFLKGLMVYNPRKYIEGEFIPLTAPADIFI